MFTLKFAVVREDPALESRVVERYGVERALLVASGGCSALTLAMDGVAVEAFDFNPVQLAHVEAKAAAVASGDLAALGVGDASPGGLNQRGAFEGLFRILRQVIVEFVAPPSALEAYFEAEAVDAERTSAWFASPYWPVAFQLAFADPLLLAMFGPDAIQHAAPGSYPGYFRAVFERGLTRPDGPRNPYLQHVLLGRYLPRDAPRYTRAARPLEVTLHQGALLDVEGLDRFGLFSLSNIFDWSDDALVKTWADALTERCRPGAVVLTRQLNNTRDLRAFLSPAFDFDDALGQDLQREDRSLFYNRVEVAVRR